MPYRDDLFGPEFVTTVFASEPVHNVVHREVLVRDGAGFTSHRAAGEEQSEFLASTDNWFRPITTKTGPDGALYVADMYRFVLEHPEWISPEMQARLDLRAGDYRVRVYLVRAAARRNETSRFTLTVGVTGTALAPLPGTSDVRDEGTNGPSHAIVPGNSRRRDGVEGTRRSSPLRSGPAGNGRTLALATSYGSLTLAGRLC